MAGDWLADLGPPAYVAPVTFLPVPWVDPRLGLAVLHHRHGRTAVYCRQQDMAEPAAVAMSRVAGPSDALLVRAAWRNGPPHVRVALRDHALVPASLHPVVALARPPRVTLYVCSRMLSAEMATVLSALGTEQLRCLMEYESGRPGLLHPVR